MHNYGDLPEIFDPAHAAFRGHLTRHWNRRGSDYYL